MTERLGRCGGVCEWWISGLILGSSPGMWRMRARARGRTVARPGGRRSQRARRWRECTLLLRESQIQSWIPTAPSQSSSDIFVPKSLHLVHLLQHLHFLILGHLSWLVLLAPVNFPPRYGNLKSAMSLSSSSPADRELLPVGPLGIQRHLLDYPTGFWEGSGPLRRVDMSCSGHADKSLEEAALGDWDSTSFLTFCLRQIRQGADVLIFRRTAEEIVQYV